LEQYLRGAALQHWVLARKFTGTVDDFFRLDELPQEGIVQVLDELIEDNEQEHDRPVSLCWIRGAVRGLLYFARKQAKENIELRGRVETLEGMINVKKYRVSRLEAEVNALKAERALWVRDISWN
jgi:hypothetical protein